MARDITLSFDDGSTHLYQNVPDDVTPDQVEKRASKDFQGKKITNIDGGKKSAATPQQPKNEGSYLSQVGNQLADTGKQIVGGIVGGADATLAMGTGAIAGTLGAATNLLSGENDDVRAKTESMQKELAWQPRTEEGREILASIGKPIAAVGNFAHNVTASVVGEGAANTLGDITTVASALLPAAGAIKGLKGAAAAGDAAKTAESFAASQGLDWSKLSDSFKERLTAVAGDAKNLDKLDPEALKREAQLSSLPKPITSGTKGQLTRDPLQQRTEQLLKATDAGAELRQIDIEQNAALQENLDVLRGKTNASGDLNVGKSVQGALRDRYKASQRMVSALYKKAEAAGELQGPVNVDKVVEYLTNHEDPSQVSYALSKLKKLGVIQEESEGGITVNSNRPMTLNELEGVRRAAVAAGKDGGTKGHYAGELRSIIDEAEEGAGGEAFKAARAARKQVGDEFERTSAIARLVKNKRMSSDRATALEDTFHKTVLEGSLEDVMNVKKSLQGSKGTAAWNDLRGAVIDYIKDKATGGKLGLTNQAGDLNATWGGMKRAIENIGDDKLKFILGENDANILKDIVDAAQVLKTEAPTGVKGSATADKMLTLLDRLGGIPFAGKAFDVVSGVGKGIKKASQIGKGGRDTKEAMTSPLSQAAKDAEKGGWKKTKRAAILGTQLSSADLDQDNN